MSCNPLGSNCGVTVSQDGDLLTFTLEECRFTGPDLKRAVLNDYACKYLSEEGELWRVKGICCGQLPLEFSGNQAFLLIPGLGDEFAGLVKAAFGAGEVGAWFRPDDPAGQWTTEAATTPVGSVGDTIGFVLDKSLGAQVSADPGDHAFQATASKRPLFARVPSRGRVNNFINTENLLIGWSTTNATIGLQNITAPDGTLTATQIFETSATGIHIASQVISDFVGIRTNRIFVKANGRNHVALSNRGTTHAVVVDLVSGVVTDSTGITGTPTVVDAGNGWWEITFGATWPGGGATNCNIYSMSNGVFANRSFAGNPALGVLVWHPQNEDGPTTTPYQRVGLGAFDVTEEGEPTLHGWLFDGIDDGLETNSIDMTGTNKVTAVCGYRRLNQAATHVVNEHSVSSFATDGAFSMYCGSGGTLEFRSRGTVVASRSMASTAPVSIVFTGEGDIAAPFSRIRGDSNPQGQTTTSQGTGNYGNHKHFIGCRGGSSLFFPGYMFGYMFRGAASVSDLIQKIEKFIGKRTGKNL